MIDACITNIVNVSVATVIKDHNSSDNKIWILGDRVNICSISQEYGFYKTEKGFKSEKHIYELNKNWYVWKSD